MTGMGKKRELRQYWQKACKPIPAQADVETLSRSPELAIFMDAKLDVSKVPAHVTRPGARRDIRVRQGNDGREAARRERPQAS